MTELKIGELVQFKMKNRLWVSDDPTGSIKKLDNGKYLVPAYKGREYTDYYGNIAILVDIVESNEDEKYIIKPILIKQCEINPDLDKSCGNLRANTL